jgi:hypothetical protein
MLLVNDPNTALVGSLRPSRQHPLWAALRRPFERAPVAVGAAEPIAGLRPRPGRWLGAGLLLVLGIGGAVAGPEHLWKAAAEAGTTTVAPRAGRAGTTTLALRAPPPPAFSASARIGTPELSGGGHDAAALPVAAAITASVATTAPEARAAASSVASKRPAPDSAATVSGAPAKKKAKAKPLRREFSRALAKRRAPR